MSKMKMAILSAIVVVSGIQIGCTQREVVTGLIAGTVGVAIGQASMQGPSCGWVPGHQVCGYYRCRWVPGYDSCYSRGPRYLFDVNSKKKGASIEDLMAAYKLDSTGATKLATALNDAQTAKNESDAKAALATVGIDVAEVQNLIASSQTPTDAMVDRIARSLDQDPENTKEMIQKIAEMARARYESQSQNNM